jgi:hypothetical protein
MRASIRGSTKLLAPPRGAYREGPGLDTPALRGYGDGPDLDGNAIPDEIGINPDSLQPGYPNSPSTSGDWGGVGAPDPTGPDAKRAEAMTDEYGDGSGLGGNWVPEEIRRGARPLDQLQLHLGGSVGQPPSTGTSSRIARCVWERCEDVVPAYSGTHKDRSCSS